MNTEDTPVNRELKELALLRGDEFLGEAKSKYAPGRSCDYRSFRLSCGHLVDVRVTHYRKKVYKCKICFEEEMHNVAAEQGLTLKSMDIVQHGTEREYLRVCGHSEIHSHAYLKKHKIVECQKCILSEATTNLASLGFTIVSKIRDGFRIQCNKCGTETDTGTTAARKGTPCCSTCFEKQLTDDAQNAGLTYLPDVEPLRKVNTSRTTLYRAYSCNVCGHIDHFGISAVKLKNVSCDKCYNTRLVQSAENQGMEYLGISDKRGMHKYKLPCGCYREINPFSVKKGVWACKEHSNTHYHRSSGVYLLQLTVDDYSWLKFGFAKDLNIRLKGYGLPDNYSHELLFYYPVERGYDALEIEKSVHRKLSEYKLNSIDMKKYMTKTGHTECYPLQVEDLITERMEELCG